MATMARWRNKSWEVSPQRITAIQDLSFAYAQKSDDNRAAEGSPSTNERGTELFTLSFTCVLHSGAGVDVRREIESWETLVTKTGPFFLNGRQLGPVLQLRKVSVGRTTLDDFGRLRLATLSFTLKEFNETVTEPPEVTTSALGVGAATADKADRKPDNGQAAGPATNINVGSMVRPTGQRYATGQNIPQWVRERSHVVSQIRGERTLLGSPGGINSWVFTHELTLV